MLINVNKHIGKNSIETRVYIFIAHCKLSGNRICGLILNAQY